ncbi:MAG: L-serine ammonia-lyase, iron-sulfur-dependent subunit beta [Termitinemataceae bacterium]
MSQYKQIGLFDILGPVMIGPSSSHTAGVGRIGFLARKLFGKTPASVTVQFYGSLATTWKGHGSGDAVVAGLLGIPPEDERLRQGMQMLAQDLAEGTGFTVSIETQQTLPPGWHPNTLCLVLTGTDETHLRLRARSIGGGSIQIDEINGYQVALSGLLEALLVVHRDQIGVIAIVSHILAANQINIAATSSHRKERGDEALLVIEVDNRIPASLIEQISTLPAVFRVIHMPALESL